MHGLLAIRDLRYLRPLHLKLPAAPTRRTMACTSAWHSLGTPRSELVLDNTLPTGQSFRWRRTGGSTYTGVVGQRLVQVQQTEEDVLYRVLARGPGVPDADDAAALHDYFNLGTNLLQLSEGWAASDPRFAHIRQYIPGARMLRQDPVECLFQFICSSNNHISRIHGMVERLCSSYGTPLVPTHPVPLGVEGTEPLEPPTPPPTSTPAAAAAAAAANGSKPSGSSSSKPTQRRGNSKSSSSSTQAPPTGVPPPASFFAFPTLQQLAAATEEELRAAGFGYRAKFITGSVAQLLLQPGGGEAWLHGLRQVSYQEAVEQLITLPGIGPKVAACVALFSLDKHQAVPVDTHVWNLATRHYAPRLAGKTLTPKLHGEVQRAFDEVFGEYAGWAHNTLFIAELASHRGLVPALPKASTAAAAQGGRTGSEAGGHDPSSSGSPSGLSSSSMEAAAGDSESGEEWQPAARSAKAAAAAAAAGKVEGSGGQAAEVGQSAKRKRKPSAKAAGRGEVGQWATDTTAAGQGVGIKRSRKPKAAAAAHQTMDTAFQQQQQGPDNSMVKEEVPLPLQALPPTAGTAQAKRRRRVAPLPEAAAGSSDGTPLHSTRVVAAGQVLVLAGREVGGSMPFTAAAAAAVPWADRQQLEPGVATPYTKQQQQQQQRENGEVDGGRPECASAGKAARWAGEQVAVPGTPGGMGGRAAPVEGSPSVAVLVSADTAVSGGDV